MSELSGMTGKNIPDPEVDTTNNEENTTPTVASAVPYEDPTEELAASTVPTEDIPVGDYSTLPPVDQIKPTIKRVHTPGQGTAVQTETAQNIGEQPDAPQEEVLDPMKMGLQQESERYAQMVAGKNQEMTEMFQQLQKDEEERIERLIEKENVIAQEGGVTTRAVTYDDREKAARRSDDPALDPYDLAPGYTDEDLKDGADDSVSELNPASAVNAPPDPGTAEYVEYIKNMPVAETPDDEKSPVIAIRDPQVVVVPKNVKPKILGDQAFMNAITNFKRTTFGKVTVPLVNSGFTVDMVGTGVVDLQNLYMNISEDTTQDEYDLEKMATLIRNVVMTNPKIPQQSLSSMIHYRDYEMMSFGHVCATLKKVETLTNCPVCGAPFRLDIDPAKLLLNKAELAERAAQIAAAPNVESVSLMTHLHEISTSVGITVVLGHPSYAEYIRAIAGYQAKLEELTTANQRRFRSMRDTLLYVRKVKMPNGTESNNIYQHYLGLGMVTDNDFTIITEEIKKMRKQIIEPKYGIEKVICPQCKNVVKDVPYNNLLDLLFTHTTLNSLLNSPEE